MPAPVISTTSSLTIDGGTSVHITSDSDITTWHANYGTLTNAVLRSVDWTAPNETRTANVYGVGSSGTSNTLTFTVNGLISNNWWAWKTPVSAERDTLIFRPQAGPSQTRTLSGRYLVYQLGNDQLWEGDFYNLLAFYTYHHPSKQFYLDDPTLQRKVPFESDSKLQFSPVTSGQFSFNWQIREAWPLTVS